MHFLNRRRLLQSFGAATALSFCRADSQEVEIATPLGRLQGWQQNGVKVFRGIPFAQPPLEKLRFRPPIPCQPWAGVRQSFMSPAPIQTGEAKTSEDCLYLNVFAPAESGPHPVFVWIYGGGNIGGSANHPMLDGSNFARDGVVCVVINYRVGALGFLELNGLLEGFGQSGNLAIHDQLAALGWVKQFIDVFGGNPQRITIGGESAGAKNVAAVMASRGARGLFQRAISESGSAQTVHSMAQARDVTSLFLHESGLKAEQLPTLPSEVILEAQRKLLSAYPRNYPFRPVVDGRLIADVPLHSIAKESLPDINMLLGTNRDESSLFVDPEQATGPLNQKELGNAPLQKLSPIEKAYEQAFPNVSTPDRHIRMLTAEEYWIPTVRIAEARASQQSQTFLYRFDHTPTSGRFAHKAAHASELAFVWDHAAPETQVLATAIHAAWVSFIKTGHPSASGLPDWPAFRLPGRLTMLLNDRPSIESDPNGEERRIWTDRL